MIKYELLPQQLLHEGTATPSDFFEPSKLCSDEDILRVHTREYLEDLKSLTLERRAARKLGFPLSAQLVERELRIAQGTIEGCLKSLDHRVSMNIAGGTHHAYTDHGEAFCLLNDQAIAARYLQYHNIAEKILIVDLDVHQGNGTAEIFENDDSVFTFSMHGAGNYPFYKETSDLDIAVPDGSDDSYSCCLLFTQKREAGSIKLQNFKNFAGYSKGISMCLDYGFYFWRVATTHTALNR